MTVVSYGTLRQVAAARDASTGRLSSGPGDGRVELVPEADHEVARAGRRDVLAEVGRLAQDLLRQVAPVSDAHPLEDGARERGAAEPHRVAREQAPTRELGIEPAGSKE